MSDEQTPMEESEAPKKKRLRIEPFPVLGTKPESESEPESSFEHSLADEAEDVGPAIDQDALAAAASPPKSMPGTSASESPKFTTPPVSTAQPLGVPRKPNMRLRRHSEDDDSPHGPLELRDGLPPPTAVVVPYGRGIKADPTPAPRHRPATYEPVAAARPDPQAGVVSDMRSVPPRLEAPLPAHAKKDSNVASIYEALAHLGPGETVVDVVVEVFDETMNQFWQIGQASSQPLTVIREPGRYLRWGGFYRVSVCPTGEGFNDKKTRSFTSRIIGPPRPANWRFDESDIGSNVYGEREEFPMGFIPQQMMPQMPAPDPAETVVRSARALKELENLWKKPDKDDDEKQRVSDLEAELRVARQGGGAWGGPPPWAMGGGGWGGMPRRNDDEERRRREEEDRRRADEERRRTEEEHRREEERRRTEEERRREDERRRVEDERRHAEELRRAEEQRRAEDDRRRELAEVRSQFDKQMQELSRSREEDKRRWEEERSARLEAERKAHEGIQSLQAQREREEERRRYEDARRDDKEKWEADRRRADEQFAEMRRQNELLAQKLERPQESTVDKLLGNLPQLMMQWQNMSASSRTEQLEAQRIAREDARTERERAREDGTRQMQMWQEMSKMNVESLRAQSEQSQQYSRNLLELLGKNGSGDILNSVAGAMNMAVQAQTNALSAIAKSGLGGGGGPSPWVDVAAGAIEAAGGIASSIIASKMGMPPEAMRQMLGGGAESAPPGPPIRRPPPQALPPQQQQRRQAPPQAPPQRQAPAQAQVAPAPARVAPRQPSMQVQPVPQPQVQPQPEAQQAAPGLPQKQVKRVLDAAAAGEPPTVVARKLFALVETCDVNELHIGNPEAERIMAGLTNEAKVPEMLREFFSIAEVTDEEYLEAIRVVYIKLIYAYVEALQEEEVGAEGEAEGEGEAEAEGEEGEEEAEAEGEEGEAEGETGEAEPPAEEPPAEAPVVAAPVTPEPVPAVAAPAQPVAPRGRPRRRIIPQPPQQEAPPAAAEPAPETT